ncbi:MAG: AAA family ATPase [Fibromonadales bacterium]|nr:AAA family ATPase [Fibromonadales bacterium]
MKTGVTLGKYAPFHKGHEFVIATALKEMEYVIVIVYNASDVTDIPTIIRANWIKKIFPSVEVIIAEDGPQDTGYTQEIIEKQNRFLNKLLQGKQIDSFYSSENYGSHVSKALNCKNRTVDAERINFAISSSKIRETKNIKLVKNFVSRCVYNELKPKYYFIGGTSTGKTTTAQTCADLLHGSYCLEYGREYWFKFQKKHRLSMNDLENIAFGHTKIEERICEEDCDLMFIDTNILTTYCYALYYFNEVSKSLTQLLNESLYKYKNLFLCDEDIPFEDTFDRSGPKSRAVLQQINKTVLEQYGLKYTLLSGTLEKRVESVKNHIKARFGYEFIQH